MRGWAQTVFAAIVAITATATSISPSAAYFEAQADSPQDAEDLRVQEMLMRCWWAPTLRGVTVNVNVFFDSNGHWSKWKFLGSYNWDARTAMTNALHGCGTDPTLSDKHFHVLLRAPTEAEVTASKIASQPVTQAAPAAPPADTQQTYSDPALYCRTFGNVDKPGKRYVGPALTDAIAGAFKKKASDNPNIQWRCMDGAVVACLNAGSGSSCDKVVEGGGQKDARGFAVADWRRLGRTKTEVASGTAGDVDQINALLDQRRKEGEAAAADAVPLKRGNYVRTNVACSDASNSIVLEFDGTGFSEDHMPVKSVKSVDTSGRKFARNYLDESGETVEETYLIKSHTEFTRASKFGEFDYRYCDQSELTEVRQSAEVGGGQGRASVGSKRDILGFRVGVDTESIAAASKASGCYEVGRQDNRRFLRCPNGRLELQLTTQLQPPLISTVIYRFCDLKEGQQVSEDVASQFGLAVVAFHWGGQAAYQIDPQTSLKLDAVPFEGCEINGIQAHPYFLTLKDALVMQLDLQAVQQLRTNAPATKF